MEDNHCWQCGAAAEVSLFCRFCNSLQQPRPDYYRFFSFEKRFHLDLAELERRFYSLSRQLHPDLFFRSMPREREYSLEATAILNDAYRTLRDPVLRAEYLLKELGAEPGARERETAPPELLEEVFEVNELLEETRTGQRPLPQLQQVHQRFLALRLAADRELDDIFRRYDAAADPALLAAIRAVLSRRRYTQNLLAQIEKELAP